MMISVSKKYKQCIVFMFACAVVLSSACEVNAQDARWWLASEGGTEGRYSWDPVINPYHFIENGYYKDGSIVDKIMSTPNSISSISSNQVLNSQATFFSTDPHAGFTRMVTSADLLYFVRVVKLGFPNYLGTTPIPVRVTGKLETKITGSGARSSAYGSAKASFNLKAYNGTQNWAGTRNIVDYRAVSYVRGAVDPKEPITTDKKEFSLTAMLVPGFFNSANLATEADLLGRHIDDYGKSPATKMEAFAFADPIFTIDETFAQASDYGFEFSPGITNGGVLPVPGPDAGAGLAGLAVMGFLLHARRRRQLTA